MVEQRIPNAPVVGSSPTLSVWERGVVVIASVS